MRLQDFAAKVSSVRPEKRECGPVERRYTCMQWLLLPAKTLPSTLPMQTCAQGAVALSCSSSESTLAHAKLLRSQRAMSHLDQYKVT
jgi:hypothetical protein